MDRASYVKVGNIIGGDCTVKLLNVLADPSLCHLSTNRVARSFRVETTVEVLQVIHLDYLRRKSWPCCIIDDAIGHMKFHIRLGKLLVWILMRVDLACICIALYWRL